MTDKETGQTTTLSIARSLYDDYAATVAGGAVCNMTNALMLAFCDHQEVVETVMAIVERRKDALPDGIYRRSVVVRTDIRAEYRLKALRLNVPSLASLNNALICAYLESTAVRELVWQKLRQFYILEAPNAVTPV